MTRCILEYWEKWDGSECQHLFKPYDDDGNPMNAEYQAQELALSLLESYDSDIRHYADFMAARGYGYEDTYHNALMENIGYKVWYD